MQVTYNKAEEPIKVSEYHGKPVMFFGSYRISEGDVTAIVPHTGIPGTVGAIPSEDEEWAKRILERHRQFQADHGVA